MTLITLLGGTLIVRVMQSDPAANAAPPASAPAASTQPRETTTSWRTLRDAYRRAGQLDSGVVSQVAHDGIAMTVEGRQKLVKKYRVDAGTRITVAKPSAPNKGDHVTNATVVAFAYGQLADIRQGFRATVGWDGEHAVFIEVIPYRGDIVVVGKELPLQPTPLPSTQPTTRESR